MDRNQNENHGTRESNRHLQAQGAGSVWTKSIAQAFNRKARQGNSAQFAKKTFSRASSYRFPAAVAFAFGGCSFAASTTFIEI